jgi:hypothetical protein
MAVITIGCGCCWARDEHDGDSWDGGLGRMGVGGCERRAADWARNFCILNRFPPEVGFGHLEGKWRDKLNYLWDLEGQSLAKGGHYP